MIDMKIIINIIMTSYEIGTPSYPPTPRSISPLDV